MQPTIVTWILVIYGAITLAPLLLIQLLMLVKPNSQKIKDLIVAKGADWRDKTHFRSALGFAWADWLIVAPLLISGSIGVILGYAWGYVLWGATGSISLYINIVLCFLEKEYVYPSRGALSYYTSYWGVLCILGGSCLNIHSYAI